MYIPNLFRSKDFSLIEKLCKEYSLATVISHNNDEIIVNPIPLLAEFYHADEGKLRVTLWGHLTRSNPQWKAWSRNTVITCIFNGPNRYISPKWYSESLNVPTWNYTTVEFKGKPILLSDPEEIDNLLRRQVTHFETLEGTKWEYDLPEDFRSKLTQAIVGFKIEVDSFDAKFKLSQNRTKEDLLNVIHSLESQNTSNSLTMANWMRLAHKT